MMEDKESLLKKIENYGAMDPSIYGDLLSLAGRKWEEIQKAEGMKRDKKSSLALCEITTMFGLERSKKPFSQPQTIMMLEAFAAACPDAKGGSPAQVTALERFAASCRAHAFTPECDFIKDIRGKSEFLAALYRAFPEEANV